MPPAGGGSNGVRQEHVGPDHVVVLRLPSSQPRATPPADPGVEVAKINAAGCVDDDASNFSSNPYHRLIGGVALQALPEVALFLSLYFHLSLSISLSLSLSLSLALSLY